MLAKRDFIKGLLAYAGSVPVASAFARDGSDAALCYASVSELIAAFKAGRLSPVELLQAQIKRIEEYNPVINAITYKHFGQAIADAKASEERYKKGTERPLEGITVAIKDENDRVGWRTTMGSLVYKDAPFAKENSPIIDALEATGAVLHIQTTVPEFYLSVSASTYAWGTTRNPWNLEYSPGGSSSGSGAALAAGFATLATGSDMGGSIRLPASQCGLYGFKPPFGRVATSDISYESLGPLARRFDDLSRFQNAIAGPSPKVLSSLKPRLDYPLRYDSISAWRIAFDWGAAISDPIPSMRSKMLEGIKRLRDYGCIVEEVDCGFSSQQVKTFQAGLMSTSMGLLLITAENNRNRLTPYVKQQLEDTGKTLGPAQAAEADELATKLHRQIQERVFSKGFHVLLMPTTSTPYITADTLSSKEEVSAATGMKYALTWPWNLLSRYPVVDVPLGLIEKSMPVGMQVIGDTFDDLAAFRFAYEWEKLSSRLFEQGRFPSFRAEPLIGRADGVVE
jgi:amidase